jgi:hypothetical protein
VKGVNMKHPDYKLYVYDGPVEEFGKCVTIRWIGETYAPSEKKARSNLTYQYKKEFDKAPCAQVKLPGKIECRG